MATTATLLNCQSSSVNHKLRDSTRDRSPNLQNVSTLKIQEIANLTTELQKILSNQNSEIQDLYTNCINDNEHIYITTNHGVLFDYNVPSHLLKSVWNAEARKKKTGTGYTSFIWQDQLAIVDNVSRNVDILRLFSLDSFAQKGEAQCSPFPDIYIPLKEHICVINRFSPGSQDFLLQVYDSSLFSSWQFPFEEAHIKPLFDMIQMESVLHVMYTSDDDFLYHAGIDLSTGTILIVEPILPFIQKHIPNRIFGLQENGKHVLYLDSLAYMCSYSESGCIVAEFSFQPDQTMQKVWSQSFSPFSTPKENQRFVFGGMQNTKGKIFLPVFCETTEEHTSIPKREVCLFCFDRENGDICWSTPMFEGNDCELFFENNNAVFLIDNNETSAVYWLDIANGSILKKQSISSAYCYALLDSEKRTVNSSNAYAWVQDQGVLLDFHLATGKVITKVFKQEVEELTFCHCNDSIYFLLREKNKPSSFSESITTVRLFQIEN